MKAQEYIQSKLGELKEPMDLQSPSADKLEDEISRLVLSKKFRKYSANKDLIDHIKVAVHKSVINNEPINFTFLHGAYKLWRLNEAPEADWAELFSLMYYANYVKPICEIYEPGVWFDFLVDDIIIEKLDNLKREEIQAYMISYQALIDFLRPFQPSNLKMTITPVSSQFDSEEAFNKSVKKNLADISTGGLPKLSENEAKMVELNVRATDEQLRDPLWKEKVYQLHNAYMISKGEPGYHKNRDDKILVFTQPLPSGTTVSLGTTKSSIMKFWIGAGVLKRNEDSFKQMILSHNQLSNAEYNFEKMNIDGLIRKNFSRIRILS